MHIKHLLMFDILFFCNGLEFTSQCPISPPTKFPINFFVWEMNLGFHCGIDCCAHGRSATCHKKIQSNPKHGLPHWFVLPDKSANTSQMPHLPTLSNPLKLHLEFHNVTNSSCSTCHWPAMTASSIALCRALMCCLAACGAMSCCGVVVSFVALS